MQSHQVIDAVERRLTQLLESRIQSAGLIGEPYAKLWRHIEAVAMAGGKRIRPLLTVTGYGKVDDVIVSVALAQELIHIAVLIHDDVIDQDFTRHGRLNMSGRYREYYQKYLDQSTATQYAHSAAILAGDLLIAEAYRLVQAAALPEHLKARVTDQLSLSIFEVIGGELLDIEAAFVTDEEFDPMTVYRYKTAGYSFIGPLLSGAHCAELHPETIQRLHDFAEAAGIAFQIQDDILGVLGDSTKTGKPSATDLREGKQTILVQYHKELMADDRVMHEHFMHFGQATSTDAQLLAIARDIDQSGARARAEALAARYFAVAEAELRLLEPGVRREALENLLTTLRGREK